VGEDSFSLCAACCEHEVLLKALFSVSSAFTQGSIKLPPEAGRQRNIMGGSLQLHFFQKPQGCDWRGGPVAITGYHHLLQVAVVCSVLNALSFFSFFFI
jgi:hypothetical protein